MNRWRFEPARLELTKTAEERDVPITQRLNGVLEMRRHAPDGSAFPGDAFVFGDAVGGPMQSFRRSWEDTALKARTSRRTASADASAAASFRG